MHCSYANRKEKRTKFSGLGHFAVAKVSVWFLARGLSGVPISVPPAYKGVTAVIIWMDPCPMSYMQ